MQCYTLCTLLAAQFLKFGRPVKISLKLDNTLLCRCPIFLCHNSYRLSLLWTKGQVGSPRDLYKFPFLTSITCVVSRLDFSGFISACPLWKSIAKPLSSMIKTESRSSWALVLITCPHFQWITWIELKHNFPNSFYCILGIISKLHIYSQVFLYQASKQLLCWCHVWCTIFQVPSILKGMQVERQETHEKSFSNFTGSLIWVSIKVVTSYCYEFPLPFFLFGHCDA